MSNPNVLSAFYGSNAGYVLALYEQYVADPTAVSPHIAQQLAQLAPFINYETTPTPKAVAQSAPAPALTHHQLRQAVAVANLAQAIREYGHLAANTNPLYPPPGDPSLLLETYNLTIDDLRQMPADLVGGPVCQNAANAYEAIEALRQVYTGGAGYDYDHLTDPTEREWLREAAESRRFRQAIDPDGDNAIRLLKRLIKVEVLEQFLHKAFLGKKRFSIEGVDMLVPMLDEIIISSGKYNVQSVLLGMAHRGRLNVMAHVLNKLYSDILREFKDPLTDTNFSAQGYLGKTGDVKYHKGAYRVMATPDGVQMEVKIAPNPSHLELVNPVVAGMARAAGTDTERPGQPRLNPQMSLPIQIHGDASFSGQGIVAETLNLANLPGYTTGGTIHIIANNQVGFTTDPSDSRSTLYASDLAKGFKMPIIHVNANDPVTCIEVARLAAVYRNKFHKDILLDLVGYRRYGHNEGDEPRFTQPMMYETIDAMPTVLRIWADELVRQGYVTAEMVEGWIAKHFARLQATLDSIDVSSPAKDPSDVVHNPEPGVAQRVDTAVSAPKLTALHQALMQFPPNFKLYSRLKRVVERRASALDNPQEANIDWGTAEQLAFASILADGIPIRLTGEDVKRGTFSHRHAVFFDETTGEEFVPLQRLPQAEASFEIFNSPLTENATIGFEYGYNIERPERLVLWEAQFGDFVNVAQPMIDQYIVSGRAKWNQTPSLVLLLPHGYEGQGPDHSTSRVERFLQLTGEKNMRIANPTTAAQYFHLLRRQALLLKKDPLPLVVLTPKSLLRHPLAASSLEELATGRWQAVLDDEATAVNPAAVERLVLCSGKIYVDLVTSEFRAGNTAVALVRVEQLYPFPKEQLIALLARYPNLKQVVWSQEEPRDMGAWRFMQPRLNNILGGIDLKYIGRPRLASTAEGSTAWHNVNQQRIIAATFDLNYIDEELHLKNNY
jgi:2-oxoglutarate dehydrogenase E1 component